MADTINYVLDPIGFIRSGLRTREDAPRQGFEGAPDVWLELAEAVAPALQGVEVGDEFVVITWPPVHEIKGDGDGDKQRNADKPNEVEREQPPEKLSDMLDIRLATCWSFSSRIKKLMEENKKELHNAGRRDGGS
ncbi:hypothetical protein [Puia sp.]|jgi:hypothetical protein|uniref:hypothetical protein n=1 Tax=Puia sp. TaxID=2045100 RepID=UPI002F403F9A